MGYFGKLFHSFGRWLFTSHHNIRDIAVTVENTREEIDTADVVKRLDGALALIDQYTPYYGRRLRRDIGGILVRRYPCRGAYFEATRTCLIELTFCVNASITEAQMAATILHEGMHARLHALGPNLKPVSRAREERFCRRAELEFGQIVPNGDAVIARALESLALADNEVAPNIDWNIAARRVAQADLDAFEAPLWIKRILARRRGLDG